MKPLLLARFVLPIFLAFAVLSFGGNHSQTQSSSLQNYTDGELLVKFRPVFLRQRAVHQWRQKIRILCGGLAQELQKGMSVAEVFSVTEPCPCPEAKQIIYRVRQLPRSGSDRTPHQIQAPPRWEHLNINPNVWGSVDWEFPTITNSPATCAKPGENGCGLVGNARHNVVDTMAMARWMMCTALIRSITIRSDGRPDTPHVAGTLRVGNNGKAFWGIGRRIMAINADFAEMNFRECGRGVSNMTLPMRHKVLCVRHKQHWGCALKPQLRPALKYDCAQEMPASQICAGAIHNNNVITVLPCQATTHKALLR